MSQKMSKSEIRFREGKGAQYMQDGVSVRCQAVSKSYLRDIRLERGDPEISSDDVWPEGQCTKKATPGTFLCIYHGGETPGIERNPIEMFMPIDLAEKMEVLSRNPDYLNRQSEIYQLLSRNAELYERLRGYVFPTAVRSRLMNVAALIEENELVKAVSEISSLYDATYDEKEIRAEIRENITLIKNLTSTQVTTAKELKTMATADQVTATLLGIFDVISKAITRYVKEPDVQQQFLLEVSGAIRRHTNTGASGSSFALGDGGSED